MFSTYRNSFYKPSLEGRYGPEFYVTDEEPTEYKGFLIYRRIAACFDCVLAGINGPECIGQYAGMSGAKRFIDDFWARENAA